MNWAVVVDCAFVWLAVFTLVCAIGFYWAEGADTRADRRRWKIRP